ncbi:trichohyalin isoform X3 [Betta splendens]|uniref:Trichohyalin isoform X3 n=1 Tax=Betta splendens TaxID=158456 RepID=A0A6P7LI32_BETSP|nr:trichohyalin isoform X3 [Betta splendens]
MESSFLIGWQQEKAELTHEVSRLQEELAENRAEREELESRSMALNDRLRQSVTPALALSLQVEGEQRAWKKKVRDGREREARQTLLVHQLQNKVFEYRDRCQELELLLQDEHKRLLNTGWRIGDEHNKSLESVLIRLEEEQQRSVSLAETNTLLCKQLTQSQEDNQAIRGDLQKLTADWTKAVEEAEHKDSYWQRENKCRSDHEAQHQASLLSVWGSVVALRQQCHTLKIAAYRDLWQLKAEFSQMSSSLLSSCESLFPFLKLCAPHLQPSSLSQHQPFLPFDLPQSSLSPPLCSTLLHQPLLSSALSSNLPSATPGPPLASTSTLGTFSLAELECIEEKRMHEEKKPQVSELNLLHEAEVSQLKELITELSHHMQAEQSLREEKEHEIKKRMETETCLQSVSQGVIRLFRVLSSCSSRPLSVSLESILSLDLCALLSVLSHTESALRWRNEELQGAELSVRRLSEEKTAMQLSFKQLEDENQQLRTHLQQTQVELTHTLDLLNREQEAISSLRLQVEEVQTREEGVKRNNDRLRREIDRHEERTRQLESGTHKRVEMEFLGNVQLQEKETLHHLKSHTLKVECELSDSQPQLQALMSEVSSLQREVKTFKMDCTELRVQKKLDAKAISQLRERPNEWETITEERESGLISLKEAKEKDGRQLEKLSFKHDLVCTELKGVQEQLRQAHEEVRRRDRQQVEQQRDGRKLQEEQNSLESHLYTHTLEAELQELKSETVSLHQQLGQHQKQLSLSQMATCQLQTHIHTLQQTKETFHGEIVCLRAELEQAVAKIKDEKDTRKMNRKDNDEQQLQVEMLMEETQTLRKRRKEEEQERNEERKSWQREREALSEELGKRKGEVGVLRRRTKGLTDEKQDIQRGLQGLMKEIAAEEAQTNQMFERIQWMEGEKGRLEKDMIGLEVRMREKGVTIEARRREEKIQRDREVEALYDRLDRLEREKEERQDEVKQVRCEAETELETWKKNVKKMEVEINRLTEEISLLEDTREVERRKERLQGEEDEKTKEKMIQLRDAAKKAEENMEKLKSRMKEVESETEQERSKNEKMQIEKQEAETGLLEKAGEMELLGLGLNMVKEEREKMKEEVDRMKCRLEHQMSAVREREEEVENLKKHLKLMEKREEKALREQQEANEKLFQKDTREEQLETLLRESQILLETERRVGHEKDDRLFSQATELQEAHNENERSKRMVKEREVAQKEELSEWRERAEHSKKEVALLSQVFKQQEKEVHRLKVSLKERDKEEREGQKITEERRGKLESKITDLDKEKTRLEDKLKEVEEKWEEERGVVRSIREEVKRMEDRSEEMKNEIKELRRAKEETRSFENNLIEQRRGLEDKVLEREKEIDELNKELQQLGRMKEEKIRIENKLMDKEKEMDKLGEMLSCKEEEKRTLVGRLKEAKKEHERLRIRKAQHLLVVKRGKFFVREMEEKKAGLSVELRRRKQEVTALREEVQRERDKTQKELRRQEQEVLMLKNSILTEQGEKRDIQEKLWRTESEVTLLREEIKLILNKDEDAQGEITALKEYIQKEQRSMQETQCDAQQQMEELQDELSRTRSKLSLLKVEIQSKQKDKMELQEELKQRKAEVEKEKRMGAQQVWRRKDEELRRTKEELTDMAGKLQEEQSKKVQIQEKLASIDKEVTALREELQKEQRKKEEVQEELRGVQQSMDVMTVNLNFLQGQLSGLSESRQGAWEEVKMKEEQNWQIKEGLRAALEEMTKLKVLLQESYTEGERLRNALNEKKQEIDIKEANLQAVREEVEKEREEFQKIRVKVETLDRRRKEMMDELLVAKRLKRKAEEEKRESEELWRTRLEEREIKLTDLTREIQILKAKEEAVDKEFRLRLEENIKKGEENRAELSQERATLATLEEQKSQSSPAAEKTRGNRSEGEVEEFTYLWFLQRSTIHFCCRRMKRCGGCSEIKRGPRTWRGTEIQWSRETLRNTHLCTLSALSRASFNIILL